ncbi:MAG: hypothetical protein HKO71_01855 [Pseudomonadales bacterium]|nr:hypothetical protein [Pseudomonadales bacterium]
MPIDPSKATLSGGIAVAWGIGGFFLLMANAITHLAGISLDATRYTLTPLQWLALLGGVVFMAYSEGYKGFQQNFSPRFAARARYLSSSGSLLEKLLAPLFCMSFFNASKKRLVVAYSLLLMIVSFIILLRLVPQPWRGVIDAGVVVGLVWGLVSTAWCCYLAFSANDYSVDPELRYARY